MRAAAVWMPVLVLVVGASGCSSSSSPGGGGSGGSAGSGAAGGSAGTAGSAGTLGSGGGVAVDAGSDGSADAASDAPPTVQCDPTTEIQQPGTTLCWRRCSLEQSPDAGGCSGNLTSVTWCDATGNSATGCTPSTPGKNICETVLGAGYRLSTVAEWKALLGGCKQMGAGGVNTVCNACSASSTCTGMFPSDTGTYWLADGSSGNGYAVSLKGGGVAQQAAANSYPVRCVR